MELNYHSDSSAMTTTEANLRVLSIQSHVVSGYVGNKCAVFPLQLLGFEVDDINSVQFCCHTGYSVWQGQVLDESDLTTLIDGLVQNDLHRNFTHILTGYVGSLSFLKKVFDVIKEVKKHNPDAIYVCDPVMGDAGSMYVPKELLPFYRDRLVSLADILTPNQFEAELLSGVKIESDESAFEAINILHGKGPRIVVISSSELGAKKGMITVYGSQNLSNGSRRKIKMEIDKLPAAFVGTGDLTAALLLAWLHKTNYDLAIACSKTMSTVKAVLSRTFIFATNSPDGLCAKTLELKLVQSKQDIENPPDLIRSVSIDN